MIKMFLERKENFFRLIFLTFRHFHCKEKYQMRERCIDKSLPVSLFFILVVIYKSENFVLYFLIYIIYINKNS